MEDPRFKKVCETFRGTLEMSVSCSTRQNYAGQKYIHGFAISNS